MFKKGQTALEFLMTYGWAFLVILIMIAALAYFGILNPQQFLPERCAISAGVTCNDYSANQADDELQFELVNNLGRKVDLIGITATTADGSVDCSGTTASPDGLVDWLDGAQRAFTVGCTAGDLIVGEKIKLDLVVTYQLAGSSITHPVTGSMFVQVQ